MNVNEFSSVPDLETGPRLMIKRVARRLFAVRGVHNVSVREIALAAEQRNLGVVAYYFGTKDKLISEILIDGAERIEVRRRDFLKQLEADGGPHTVRDAIAAIVLPCTEFSDDDDVYGRFFNSFLFQLSLTNPVLIDKTLEGRWNTSYQLCLSHLRRMLPQLSPAVQNRRFVFVGAYISSLIAQREAMVADESKQHRNWRSQEMLDDIIATSAALLEAPVTGD